MIKNNITLTLWGSGYINLHNSELYFYDKEIVLFLSPGRRAGLRATQATQLLWAPRLYGPRTPALIYLLYLEYCHNTCSDKRLSSEGRQLSSLYFSSNGIHIWCSIQLSNMSAINIITISLIAINTISLK